MPLNLTPLPPDKAAYEESTDQYVLSRLRAGDLRKVAAVQSRMAEYVTKAEAAGELNLPYFGWVPGKRKKKIEQVLAANLDLKRSVALRDKSDKLVGYLLSLPFEKAVEALYCSETFRQRMMDRINKRVPGTYELEQILVGQSWISRTIRNTRFLASEVIDETGGARRQKGLIVPTSKKTQTTPRTLSAMHDFGNWLNVYGNGDARVLRAYLVAERNSASRTAHLAMPHIQHVGTPFRSDEIDFENHPERGREPKDLFTRRIDVLAND